MKIAVCDDEAFFRTDIVNKINRYFFDKPCNDTLTIIEFSSGEELLNYLQINIDIDILILDILMDGKNGIEVAKFIRNTDNNICLLFVTSSTKYVFEGYKLKATRYLLKPLNYHKFKIEFDAIMNDVLNRNKNFIIEKIDTSFYKIFMQDIMYIETTGRTTLIISTQTNYPSRHRMKEHLENLNENFYRCHESYIVNLDYIKTVEKNTIILLNNKEIPISKNRRKDFIKKMNLYYSNKL